MTTTFQNIRAFQDHFATNNQLTIQPGHCLCILNTDTFTHIHKNELETDSPTTNNKIKILIKTLSKFFILTGKSLLFNINEQEINYHLGNKLEAEFPSGVAITIKKATRIFARASEFFRLMVISSQMTFKLDAEQELYFIDLKDEALSEEKILEKILTRDPLTGFLKTTLLNSVSCFKGTFDLNDGQKQNFLCLKPDQPQGSVEFSFTEEKQYLYDEERFIERMLLQPILQVPPGEVFNVSGSFINRMITIWNRGSDNGIGTCLFVLDQLFLPFGKKVSISKSNCQYINDKIEISSDEGFIIKLIDTGSRFINLEILSEVMAKHLRSRVTIPPDSDIYFYGIKKNEIEKMRPSFISQDLPKIKSGLQEFLFSRMPIGFLWKLQYFRDLFVSLPISEDDNYLRVSSPNEITISLNPALEPELFAISLVQNCDPSLEKGLVERDSSAILNLIFKSIFYFCCSNFRLFENVTIPNFFKPETKKMIEETIKDPIFNEHFGNVLNNNALKIELKAINKATPEEFETIDSNNVSIKFIINKIKLISASELQNSYYTQTSMLNVIKYLDTQNQ